MKKIKNVIIIGIGGVGGYFGGRMANSIEQLKNNEYKIHFIARGNHLSEIQKKGLILNTTNQQGIICKPNTAANKINADIEPDIIILAVKSIDLNPVLTDIAPLVAENTVILPLLNGVDIYERIRNVITKGIVLPANAYITSEITEPGVVTQKWNEGRLVIGPDPMYKGFYPDFLEQLLKISNITFEWNEKPYTDIWEKYIFVAAFSLVTARYNITTGEVFSDFNIEAITRQIITEIYNVGIKKGVELYDCIVNDSLYRGRKYAHDTRTFYQRDIEAGIKNESDIYGETIIKLANELNIDVSTVRDLHSEIQKLVNSKKKVNQLH